MRTPHSAMIFPSPSPKINSSATQRQHGEQERGPEERFQGRHNWGHHGTSSGRSQTVQTGKSLPLKWTYKYVISLKKTSSICMCIYILIYKPYNCWTQQATWLSFGAHIARFLRFGCLPREAILVVKFTPCFINVTTIKQQIAQKLRDSIFG